MPLHIRVEGAVIVVDTRFFQNEARGFVGRYGNIPSAVSRRGVIHEVSIIPDNRVAHFRIRVLRRVLKLVDRDVDSLRACGQQIRCRVRRKVPDKLFKKRTCNGSVI